MFRSGDKLKKILSLGFEFETMDMISVEKDGYDYTPQNYYYVIPIDVDGTHVKLTNDVIDKEIGKGKAEVQPLYKNGNYFGNLTRPMNAEHTELHITFPIITKSENCISEYLERSKETFHKLFHYNEEDILQIKINQQHRNIVKILELVTSEEDHIDVFTRKQCGLFMKNNVLFENACWVPQMTFGLRLSNVAEVCEFLCRGTPFHSLFIEHNKMVKELLEDLDIFSEQLHGWFMLVSFIFRNIDENYYGEKTHITFVPRHYFWEIYPFGEYDSTILDHFSSEEKRDTPIGKLIINIFRFRERQSLVYRSKKHQICQNRNVIFTDIIDYDETKELEILQCIRESANIINSNDEDITHDNFGIKYLFVDTKKYQIIEPTVICGDPIILIEYRGFLHHFNHSVIMFKE